MSVTKRDTELIVLGFQCYETQPKVDFTKLANLAGYSNAASAQTCYNSAKKKFLNSTNLTISPATGITTPATATAAPKKRKASTKTNNADTQSNPSKRGKGKTGASTTTAKANNNNNNNNNGNADGDADDNDDEDLGNDADAVALKIEEDAAAGAAAMQLLVEREAQILKEAAGVLGGDRLAAGTKTETKTENGKEGGGKEIKGVKGEGEGVGVIVKTEDGQSQAKGTAESQMKVDGKNTEMDKKADEALFANFTNSGGREKEKGETSNEV
ncbi:MAG: hypothetical protein M1830_008034 [Pleopsidium flavum]|nr:MAG: hypothetical protein M1830_008034 [Pleopsidium flavum]